MSEVMISRRGGSSSSGSSMITEIYATNMVWKVPSVAKDNQFSIRMIGPGGIGSQSGAYPTWGGSGWMNNDILTLVPGQYIPITVYRLFNQDTGFFNFAYGRGPTSFGTYLSANSGSVPNGGSGGYGTYEARGYQFGGGSGHRSWWAYKYMNWFGGGVWGGGGSHGEGGTYGGGGGGTFNSVPGNGGTYGGGGGAPVIIVANKINRTSYGNGMGGTYGGRGGAIYTYNANTVETITSYNAPENGINTSTWTNVTKDDITGEYFRGWGRAGTSYIGGGGGFGGNGGNGNFPTSGAILTANYSGAAGGGGGYGSNGGSGSDNYYVGGGGGGYGGDGGNGCGGGYGKVSVGGTYGGGGYYCPGGGDNGTKGGGGLGIWNSSSLVVRFGSGGYARGNFDKDTAYCTAEPGVCIIQYYI